MKCLSQLYYLQGVPGVCGTFLSLLNKIFGRLVGLSHLVALAFSRRQSRRLLQEFLDQGGELVALASDELLGRDFEVAHQSPGHRLLFRHLASNCRGLGPFQATEFRPIGDLVLNGSMQEDVEVKSGNIVTYGR